MQTVGTELQRLAEAKGYTHRQLAETLSKKHKLKKPLHHRTIQRYISGETAIPIEYARTLADLFFSRYVDRKQFLANCSQQANENKSVIKLRAKRKKALTKAKRSFDCRISWVSVSENEKFKEIEVKLNIFHKAAKSPALYISSIDGVQVPKNDVISKKPMKAVIEDYFHLCDKYRLSVFGFMELAKTAVSTDVFLNATDGSELHIDLQRFEWWLRAIDRVARPIALPKNVKMQKEYLRQYTQARNDMEAFRDQPQKLAKAKKKLLQKIQHFEVSFQHS